MFRLIYTRFITTSRTVTCFSQNQRLYFHKSSVQSNENTVPLSTTIDNLRWLKDSTQRRKSTNTMDALNNKDKPAQSVGGNSDDRETKIQSNPSTTTTSKSSHLPKVYTRTGDRGTSALLGSGSNRLPKDSLVFEVLGTVDELSSTIGLVRSTCSFPSISKELEDIQCSLFEIGSCVAAKNRSSRFVFNDSTLIKNLEERIDQMTDELPELRNFILSGGASQTGSYLHFSRAVCRRCERLVAQWLRNQTVEKEEEEEEPQQETVMGIYLNRLSDYLFTLARYVTQKEGHQDIIYRKRK